MDYKNSKIYKIVDIGYTKMYIGSTTQSLSKRFSKHKRQFIAWNNNRCSRITVYDIFEEFGVDNCKIELIEEYPCENKIQLHRKEGEYIKNNNCVNKNIAGRTYKEYYEANKDKISEKHNEYYESNKDKILEKQKKYREDNKDKILEKEKKYREDNKDKQKQYYESNKDTILENQKKYNEANKDKILEKKKKYYESNKDKILERQKKYYESKKIESNI